MQKQVSVKVPEDLKERMDKHREVNWSEIVRKALRKYLNKLELANKIASKSELTEEDAEELSKKVKRGIAEKHGIKPQENQE